MRFLVLTFLFSNILNISIADTILCIDKAGSPYLKADVTNNSRYNDVSIDNIEIVNQEDAYFMHKISKYKNPPINSSYKFSNAVRFWFTHVPNFNPYFWERIFNEGDLPHPVFKKASIDLYENRGHWNKNEFVKHGLYLSTKEGALSNVSKLDFIMQIVLNWEEGDDDRFEATVYIDKILKCSFQ